MTLTPPYAGQNTGLQNPLPHVPPRPSQGPKDTHGTSGPRLNNAVKPPSERKRVYNGKDYLPPIHYGPGILGGALTYVGFYGDKLALAYVWTNGGVNGINGVKEIVLNDELVLDVSDTTHAVPKWFQGDLLGWGVVTYFGLLDQPVDPWLLACSNLPGYDESFIMTGGEKPVACSYSVLIIPNPALNPEARNIGGFPRAKVELEGMRVYDYQNQIINYNSVPIYYAADFLSSRRYGMGYTLDETSLEVVANRHREQLSYEIEGGTDTIQRLEVSLSIDTVLEGEEILELLEDVCECWLDVSTGVVEFISDSPRAVDFTFVHDNPSGPSDFVGNPAPQSPDLNGIPNEVRVSFSDNISNYDSQIAKAFLPGVSDNNVKPIVETLNKPFLFRYAHAYRKAVLELNKARTAKINVIYSLNYQAMGARRGQVHKLEHPFLGELTVRCTNLQRTGIGVYTGNGVLYSADAYDDFVILENTQSSPTLSLSNAPEPKNLQLTKRLIRADGFRKVVVDVDWDASDWLGFRTFQIRAFQRTGKLIDLETSVNSFVINEFVQNTTLTVEVRTVGNFDKSEWVSKDIDTNTEALETPDPVSGLNAIVIGNTVIVAWDNPVFAENLTYDVRFYRGNTYDTSRQRWRELSVNNVVVRSNLPSYDPWTVGVKAINNLGRVSDLREKTFTIDLDDDFTTGSDDYVFDGEDFNPDGIDFTPPMVDYSEGSEIGSNSSVEGGSIGVVQINSNQYASSFGTVFESGTTEYTYLTVSDVYNQALNTFTGPVYATQVNPELHPDPTIDNPGSWTLGTGWSIAGGELTAVNVNADSAAQTNMTQSLRIGHVLLLSYFTAAYIDGFLKFRVTDNLQPTSGNSTPYITKVPGQVDVYHASTSNSDTSLDVVGDNSLDMTIQSFSTKFAPCRMASKPYDFGSNISARLEIIKGDSFYTDNAVLEYFEVSDDLVIWDKVSSPGTIINKRYVRVVIEGVDEQTSFHGQIDQLKVLVDSTTLKDSGVAVWAELPPNNPQLAVFFDPNTVGASSGGVYCQTDFGVVHAPNRDLVDDRNQRSFVLRFRTGNDVTAMQMVYGMGDYNTNVQVYIRNEKLYILGYFRQLFPGSTYVHTSYSESVVEVDRLVTVGFSYDNNSQHFQTYINGKKAELRPDYISGNVNMVNVWKGINTDLGQPFFGGNSTLFDPLDIEGQPISTNERHYFRGTITDYIQWNDRLLTDVEMYDMYRYTHSLNTHSGDIAVRYTFGNVDQNTYVVPDDSGNNRTAELNPSLAGGFGELGPCHIVAHTPPLVAFLNKSFTKLFSAILEPVQGGGFNGTFHNVELTTDPDSPSIKNTIELFAVDAVSGALGTNDIDWKITGI